jgi:hypothetical protein
MVRGFAMEPTTAIASVIATYILPEAFKEGGKALGKGVSQAVSQLITVIREKFQAAGREGTLADFEEEPTEENQSEFETVLKKLMSKDDAFAKNLVELVKQSELSGLVRQEMLTDVETESLEVGNMNQRTKQGDSIEQTMAKNLKAKSIKIGDMTQQI